MATKKTASATPEVKKLKKGMFEVTETITRNVDTAGLQSDITALETLVADIRQRTNLDAIEAQLAAKKELLAQFQ